MDSKLCETLANVTEETLMSLAFLFTAMDDEAGGEPGPRVCVQVAFTGPFDGALFLEAPADMLPELAANMLGMDDMSETPCVEHQHDAMKELINVVCGNLLPEIGGAEAVFNVAAPALQTGQGVPETHNDLPPAATADVMLDYGMVHATLFVDQPEKVVAG